MPFQPHGRLQTVFSLGNPATEETASCTLNFNPGIALTTGVGRQTMVDDCFDDWSAYVLDANARVSQHVRLEYCKLWRINAAGHAEDDTVISAGAPVRGVTTAGKHPWQCSLAMTLEAGTRGKGRFGRIYLPPQCYDMDDNGTVFDAQFNAIFNRTKTLLLNLSDKPTIDAGWGLVVAGQTGVAGTLREVERIKLGQVVDTQRRRRRSLPEAYFASDFSA